jgi:starch-binding outer membrane protein, SusD/RagB family
MKKLLFIFLTANAVVFFNTSCKKTFLDEKVYSSYTSDALSDSLSFEAAIAGIQSQYALWHTIGADNVNSQGWLCVWQMGTDVAYNKAPADLDPLAVPYTNYENLTSTDNTALVAWKWSYNLINNCNYVISKVDAAPMGQANKNMVKAEASFFRAVAYNTLATLFGRVPIITVPITIPVTTLKTDFVRAELADVNNLISTDLLFAKNNLPSINNVKSNSKGKLFGRPNKSMASQLLAEFYLRTGDNLKAEQEADAVIGSGDFNLVNTRYGVKASQPGDAFSDMFIYGNQRRTQGNRESIWTMEIENPNTITGGAGIVRSPIFPDFQFGAPQHRRVWGNRYHQQAGMLLCDSLGGRGISRLAVTYFVLNNYGTGDMRNSQFNIRRDYWYNNPASPLFGQKVNPNAAGVDTNRLIVPQITKWNQYDPNDAFGFAMIKDIIVMRLGETYLLKAEAQFKQGNTGGAATTLNILRARANAAPITGSDVTLDFILDERARELIGEENRRMTLMRTGTLVNRVVGRGLKITGIAAKHLLLPIPLSEIQLNKDAVLEQNPGY